MFNLRDREERANTLKTFLIGGSFIMCLWAILPFLIHKFVDPAFLPLGFKPVRWLGISLSGMGYCLAVWCVMLFIKEGKGTPLPFLGPKKLVMKGPYRFVRNPMVLGTVLFLAGDSILVGSLGIFIYTIAVFTAMHFFILIEEKSLLERFGIEYASYYDKTPRWLPKINH